MKNKKKYSCASRRRGTVLKNLRSFLGFVIK